MMESISVVIPVYNSEASLLVLYQQLILNLDSTTKCFEIIMVEDCSEDQSWEIILKITNMDKRVHGIKLGRNYGQHNALLCGIRAAQYEIIVTLDDDLQHPAEEISVLINKLREGYDVVYGVPTVQQHGFLRSIASHLTKIALQNAMGVNAAKNVSAFRAFRTNIREAFVKYQSPFVSIDVLLTWGTSRFVSVKVNHEARKFGESNYTFKKLITHALNMITGFSTKPLQIAILVGFTFTIFGLCVLFYVLVRYFIEGVSVPGFAFLASTIAIFSGAQLFALGILGEYMARMHFRTMNRPPYLIRRDTLNTEYKNRTRISQ